MTDPVEPFRAALVGEDTLAIQCGEILLRDGHVLVAVATVNPTLRSWALQQGVPVVASGPGLAEALAPFEIDYLLSITNLRVLPEAVLARARRAAINFHDGPLPEYAGLHTPAWALLNRESEYGISFHEMTAGVDEGAVLAERRFPVVADETSLSLNTKCFEAAIEAFEELVPMLAAGRLDGRRQQGPHVHACGKWDRPDTLGVLDFERPAAELDALVRALDFGPYENPFCAAKLLHAGQAWVVRRARAEAAGSGSVGPEPGGVLELGEAGLLIATGEGALRILELESPEGRPLGPTEAIRSLGLSEGARLDRLDSATRAALDSLASRATRAEPRIARRLARPQPPELPSLNGPAEEATPAAPRCRAIGSPPGLAERLSARAEEPGDALLLAAAAFFARVSGQTRLQLALSDPALSPTDAAGALVADWLPWQIDVPPQARLSEVVESAREDLDRLRSAGPWLRDVVGRHPALRADPARVARHALPVSVTVSDRAGPVSDPLEAGRAVALEIARDGSWIELRADGARLAPSAFTALGDQLERFLEACAGASDDLPLARVSLLSDTERRRILEEWNDTRRPFASDRCLHELIAEQAARTPEATALVAREERIDYAELERRANRLAHALREHGVGPDRLVGLFLDRSIDMVVALLGILKAGGAYVPMDPAYPRDRIAWMVEDSGARVIVTREGLENALPDHDAHVLCLDRDAERIAAHPDTPPQAESHPEQLAYVIYTSGSTGRPKGVMVEHRNVVNFLTGMDEWVEPEPPGVWMAVTSLSFDISVLELVWTLARGFEVVLYSDPLRQDRQGARVSSRPIDFGLFMWGSDDSQGADKYGLMLEAARFGDERGFSSFWTPERHFHSFGGPFPNPSVTSAAVAAITRRIAIRAGSCVLPLHSPIRVAEEWAVVDNLSGGRVGISFAAGWQPNDFVIAPDAFKDAKSNMFREIETVQRLWRGESVEFTNPMGQPVPTRTLPRPVQSELPCWVTTAGNVETFRQAGACGAHLLTHLLGQSPEEVAEKIAVYREARREAGLDPAAGCVTLMLHTLVAETDEEAKRIAREPMKAYLRSSVGLIKGFAWSFPAFKRPGGADAKPDDIDLESLTEEQLDAILEFAFERYFETSGLFGSVETCVRFAEQMKTIDVDEIGCLIDYGVPIEENRRSLELLDRVRIATNEVAAESSADPATDDSFAAQAERHGVTHLQCTPSMARMLLMDPSARPALARLDRLLVGGEALPVDLAHELEALVPGRITNMYGPTETTIWSAVEAIEGRPERISIGRPIANTQIYVLDEALEPVAVGAEGELVIGGDGVTRGYHERPDATAERFVPDPFRPGGRLYRTGDRARFRDDGRIDFLGRLDHQVKIRGYRIELGEIEARLATHEAIAECVVVARSDDAADPRLVAYAIARGSRPEPTALREHLARALPEFMIPAAFVFLDELPRTPNAKIDRAALPAPDEAAPRSPERLTAPENETQVRVAEAWKEALRLDAVGIDENFFDLGGHSLLVIRVHRLLEQTPGIEVTLTDLYRFPTIRSLVEHLESDPGAEGAGAAAGKDRAARRRSATSRRRRR